MLVSGSIYHGSYEKKPPDSSSGSKPQEELPTIRRAKSEKTLQDAPLGLSRWVIRSHRELLMGEIQRSSVHIGLPICSMYDLHYIVP